MNDRTCTVDGCVKMRRNAAHCAMHRNRLKRTGSLELAVRPQRPCSVGDCDGIVRCYGLCKKHATRLERYGSTDLKPRRTDISYRALHSRVQRARGKAENHPCSDCGAQAEQWSYNGNATAGNLRVDVGRNAPYSIDLHDYDPRCVSCHARFDAPQACPRRHPHAGPNLIVKRDGSRACRQCKRDQARQRYAA